MPYCSFIHFISRSFVVVAQCNRRLYRANIWQVIITQILHQEKLIWEWVLECPNQKISLWCPYNR